MMEFVACVRGGNGADDARIGGRIRIDVDHSDAVWRLSIGIESRNVGQFFGRCFGRQTRRRIEARIGLPRGHRVLPLFQSSPQTRLSNNVTDVSLWHKRTFSSVSVMSGLRGKDGVIGRRLVDS